MSDTIWNAKTTKSTHSPLGDTARSIMKDTKLCYWSSYPSLRSVLHCFHVCQNLICLSSVTFSSQFSFRRLCRSHQAKIQLPLLLSHGPMLTLKMLWLSVYTFLCNNYLMSELQGTKKCMTISIDCNYCCKRYFCPQGILQNIMASWYFPNPCH